MVDGIGVFFLSFGRDVFAGMENSLANLCVGLRRHGVRVHVYSSALTGRDEAVDGIPVHRSSLLPATLPDGDDTVRAVLRARSVEIARETRDFADANHLSHVYVCDPLWGILQESGAWEGIGRPMILSLRVVNTTDLLLRARTLPYMLYTCTSHSLYRELRERVVLEPLAVVPNSIDFARFWDAGRRDPRGEGPVVLCLARIAPEKGTLDAVAAMELVRRKVEGAELWLCGGSYPFGNRQQYLAEVQGRIAALSLVDGVRILGDLSWAEIPALIARSRVVILPSYRESFGRAALEAMACGKPVVVSSAGNLPQLVEDAGIVIPPGEPAALAAAITRLLEDDALAARLGARGPQVAARYDNLLVSERLLQVIQEAEDA